MNLFRYADAEPILREAHELARETLGPNHSVFVINGNNLSMLSLERGKAAEAQTVALEALEASLQIFGEIHPETGRMLNQAAECAIDAGDAASALPLARRACMVREKTLPLENGLVDNTHVLLARALLLNGSSENVSEAERVVRSAMDAMEKGGRTAHWFYFEARGVLGACLLAQGKREEARPLLEKAFEELTSARGPRGRPTRQALQRLIRFHEGGADVETLEALRSIQLANPPR